MHIDHKAVDKMFVGFTGKNLQIVDKRSGEIKNVEVFVALLGASQYTYVEAVEIQKKHDWIKVNQNALHEKNKKELFRLKTATLMLYIILIC